MSAARSNLLVMRLLLVLGGIERQRIHILDQCPLFGGGR